MFKIIELGEVIVPANYNSEIFIKSFQSSNVGVIHDVSSISRIFSEFTDLSYILEPGEVLYADIALIERPYIKKYEEIFNLLQSKGAVYPSVYGAAIVFQQKRKQENFPWGH